jgi:glycosyltransferase involved in cell wall biosynthesis
VTDPTSPLVTVLTPAYNAEEHLVECIESVLQQTYDHWTYVIVDNCSSDRTGEIVQSFAERDPRITYVRHDEFVEVVASYNRTFEQVGLESTYTKVVGADDLLYPDCLTRMVDVAESDPRVGIVSAYRMDGDEIDLVGVPEDVTVLHGNEILRQSLLGGPYVTGSATSVLFRSHVVRQRRPFCDESFRHADTEAAYWVMTRSHFGFVHELLTFTRRPHSGETSIARRMSTYWPENIRMLIRYGPEVLSEDEYRRYLHRELRAYVWLHVKRRIKPDGRRDRAFHDFHRREIELIRSEGGDDRAVRRAMDATSVLLGKPAAA